MAAAFEAILFAAGEPVSRAKLLEVFANRDREMAGEVLSQVIDRFKDGDGRGVLIEEVAGGIRLITRPELHGYLQKFFEITGRAKLSMAALETLAIIAYREPITGPELQDLRGVNSGGVLRTLLERRLVRIAGRKPVVGRPFVYRTTREFLLQFGLQSLKDLPPLEEFEEALGVELTGDKLLPAEDELAGEDLPVESEP
jgi:segregation and condensation protein B